MYARRQLQALVRQPWLQFPSRVPLVDRSLFNAAPKLGDVPDRPRCFGRVIRIREAVVPAVSLNPAGSRPRFTDPGRVVEEVDLLDVTVAACGISASPSANDVRPQRVTLRL